MAAIETVFVDVTSVVPASWFNRLQKHLAGFLNLKVTINGDAVEVVAASSDGVASAYIGGEMRRNDTTVSFTFVAEAVDTWNVYVVATAAVDTFAVEVSLTTPATSPYRKVAEVDWDGADITELRGVRGRVIEHLHDGFDNSKIEHSDMIGMTAGDPHPMYALPDGSRDFTGVVTGVDPSASGELATKFYCDTVLSTVPIGGIFWWASDDAAPTGFLLADGAAVSRSTYDSLFAAIGETYGVGDGSTTFNLPDLRGRMIMGKDGAADLGDTGGALEHTHTQPSHTHSGDSHSHTMPTHNHAGATTGSGGSHTHTQAATSTSASHTHTGPSHSHTASSLTIGATGAAVVGSRHSGSGDSGLFPEQDLDNTSSSTSHRHGAGSYMDSTFALTGYSEYNSKSHTHPPAGNSYAHTHNGGALSGSTGSSGTAATGNNSVNHSHTNPSTASGGSHSHASGGNTGTAAPSTDSDSGSTGSDGDDVTGLATHPYLSMNALIRYG